MHTEALAKELLDAFDAGATVSSIAERHPGFGWDEGYQLAARIIELRLERGEHKVGRKIGFTNRNIWAEYGAKSPIWAHVYDRTLIHAPGNRATISLKGSIRPRLEPEIAFKLKAPLPAGATEPEDVLQRVEWIAPSFEIVDCHFADWKFVPGESVADFALHWRLVVGEPYRIQPEEISAFAKQLSECHVRLSRNGEVREKGVGANALGHPAMALVYLADVLASQPRFDPLTAGEVITTGTLTKAFPILRGETWTSSYEGLAGVKGLSVDFTD